MDIFAGFLLHAWPLIHLSCYIFVKALFGTAVTFHTSKQFTMVIYLAKEKYQSHTVVIYFPCV
jgi:hypothetical protein